MSEIAITLQARGTEAIKRSIAEYDQAVGRSAEASRANAKRAEQALDSQIKKQRELTGRLRETKDALQNADRGSEEFKRLQKEVRELAAAERDAKDATKRLSAEAEQAAAEVDLMSNSVRGLELRLDEAKRTAKSAEFGSKEAMAAKVQVEQLQAALKEAASAQASATQGSKAHANSLETLERELKEAQTELRKLDRESDTFRKQSAKVDSLKMKLDSYTKGQKEAGKAVKAHSNSIESLERNLQEAVGELRRMDRASETFAAQKQKVAALSRELQGARAGVRGVTADGRKLNAVAGNVGSQIKSLAVGFLGVSEAVAAIAEEANKVKRIQLQAADQTRTFEQSLARIAFNVGGGDLQEARSIVEQRAPELGVQQEELANLLGIAISAGAKDLETALSVVSESVKATAGETTDAAELVQTALDIASLSNSNNFGGALGQVSQTQAVVRAVNPAEFFSNLGPALAAATADRDNIDRISTERTLELSSVVSQILKDRTGANTATAIRQFVTRLDSFAPELDKTLKDGSTASVSQAVIDQFRGTRGVDDRIEILRSNEGLRQQFLALQKEGIGKSAIAEIIAGTERALQFEDRAAVQITGLEDAETSFAELKASVAENTKTLRAERSSQASVERFQTTGSTGLQGQARKIVEDTIAQLDLPGIDVIQSGGASTDLKLAADEGRNLAEVGIEILEAAKGDNLTFVDFWKRRLDEQERALVAAQQEVLGQLSKDIAAAIAAENASQAPPVIQDVRVTNPPQRIESPSPEGVAP